MQLGIAQAARLGQHLNERRISRVYSSPFLRALQTAEGVSKSLDKMFVISGTIHFCSFSIDCVLWSFHLTLCAAGYYSFSISSEPGLCEFLYPGWFPEASDVKVPHTVGAVTAPVHPFLFRSSQSLPFHHFSLSLLISLLIFRLFTRFCLSLKTHSRAPSR